MSLAPDIYVVFSADCKYTGIINLTENEYTIAQVALQKVAQLQAFGTATPDAQGANFATNAPGTPHKSGYKQIAGQGKIVDTATCLTLAVPSHSIYLQEKEI